MNEASTQQTSSLSTCVVVLGSGRSGTSLAMQVISTLGVVIDSAGGSAGEQNPSGFFEDASIVEFNKSILYHVSVNQYFPNDLTGRGGSDAYRSPKRSLGEYISNRSREYPYWGFKDPRTAFMLPSYRTIFNRGRIVPKYVLCIRDPANVVASFVANYGDDPGLAQLVWFSKNLAVLRETGLNCFLLHYEKLIEEPLEQVAALQRFIFEGKASQEIDREAVLRVTRADLDRSGTNPFRITNPFVDQLYGALSACNGTDFDRNALREHVRRLSEIEVAFLPWPRIAGRTAGLLRRERDQARADAARLEQERAHARAETNEQERRCQESLAQAATATRERDGAVASVPALQKRLDSAEPEAAERKRERDDAIASVAALKERLDSAESEAGAWKREIDDAIASAAPLQRRLDSAESEAAEWKREQASLEAHCADVVQDNACLSRDMMDARVLLEEYQARSASLEVELTNLTGLVRTTEQRARDCFVRAATLENKHTELLRASKASEDEVRSKLARSNSKLSEITSYGKMLERMHIETLQSTSWRMTAPVRRLLQAVKGRGQNKAFVPRLLDSHTTRPRPSTPRK